MDKKDKAIDEAIDALERSIRTLQMEMESLIALRNANAEPLPGVGETVLEDPNTGKKFTI